MMGKKLIIHFLRYPPPSDSSVTIMCIRPPATCLQCLVTCIMLMLDCVNICTGLCIYYNRTKVMAIYNNGETYENVGFPN